MKENFLKKETITQFKNWITVIQYLLILIWDTEDNWILSQFTLERI